MKEFSFLHNVLHFDRKFFESHSSLSLNCFLQTHPTATVIKNQMDSVLSMLQSIVYKVHSLNFEQDYN